MSDTGSRPFVCAVCMQKFTRPDSLARHARKHGQEVRRNALSPVCEPRNNDSLPLIPSEERGPTESTSLRTYDSNGAYQDISQNILLDDDPFVSLNWPDSAELLDSILSADFTSLPSLEVLPSQSLVRGAQALDSLPVSPWLASDMDNHESYNGNHAVQGLSQIINSSVCRFVSVLRGVITSAVSRRHIRSPEYRIHQRFP